MQSVNQTFRYWTRKTAGTLSTRTFVSFSNQFPLINRCGFAVKICLLSQITRFERLLPGWDYEPMQRRLTA
jgi:hypothetical protein